MARFTHPGDGSGIPGPQGEPGLQGEQGIQGEPGIQGEIGFPAFLYDPRRAFENQYTIGEIVYYAGQYWICQNNNDAIVPGTDPAYWSPYSLIGPQGEQGPQGIQGETGATGPQGEPGISGATAVLSHEVKAGEALTKGQAVYVSSADGTNMIVSKASNVTEATSSKTIGLVTTDLNHNEHGSVITEGLLTNLNTASANAGDPVWLGTNGNLIYGLANKPIAPAHLVFIGIVTRSNANTGEIFVKPQNGFELNEIHNVLIGSNYSSTPADNDILAYDTASGLWKNQTLSNLAGLTYDGTDLSLSGKFSITTSAGDEGGEIFLNKAVTNTSINGGVTIDVYRDKLRFFEQGGTARGVSIDLTKAPASVGAELSFKASGFVNAGTDVTLGNLRARVSTSGNRNLQVSTVTGTYTVYGSSVYSQNGVSGSTIDAGAPKTITTTPTSLNAGYNFISGGATDTWVIMDTGNALAWRITMIIGAGYNNNYISIERL